MMAKIRFRRSSRASVAQQEGLRDGGGIDGGVDIRNSDQRNLDNNRTNSDTKNVEIITESVSDKQQQSAKKPVVCDNKSNKKRKHPALRIFYLSSSTSSSSSTPKPSSSSPSVSISNSSPPLASPTAKPSTTDSSTSVKISNKGRKKTNEKPMKQESRSNRLFVSRLSTSSVSGGSTTHASSAINQPHITTNSSNKQVISIPLPPYEIEVTEKDGLPYVECPLCVLLVKYQTTPDLRTCSHRTCLECMQRYLKNEINHSRLKITCPICSEPLQQQVIREILHDDKFYFKYESFMLRKVLAAEPDARWCPAPDCGYAVLATGCASCPRLVCGREGCKTEFCYHCKQEWHPNQTCSAASIQRNKRSGFVLNAFNIGNLISSADETAESSSNSSDVGNNIGASGKDHGAPDAKGKNGRKSSRASQQAAANSSSLKPEDIKECPVCSSRIIKMNDGSCNHMTCSICETDFCWLCMKEISDLHYFSPSGCTFWGKKPWSRKKKLLWRLGMLVGAPICIVFIAGIAVPAIVIGIPVWAARKLHTRLEKKQFSRYRKNAIITGGVLLSFLVSPIISAMALAVGIPILLGYVYGVVPLSLCRSSGGCLSSNPSVENLNDVHQQLSSTSTSSVVNQARDQLQRLQIQQAQQEFKRQQLKSEHNMSRDKQTATENSSAVDQAIPPPYSDVVSVDTATNCKLEVEGTHQNGGSSIGEPSMYMSNISLETNSIGNVTNIIERCSRNSASGTGGCGISSVGCEDRESASNVALSGSIMSHKADDAYSTRALAGSIASKESGGYTLIPAEVHTNVQRQPISDGETRKTSSASVGVTPLTRSRNMNIETKE